MQVAACTANRLDWVERCLRAVCGTIACFPLRSADAVRDGLSAWYWTVSPQLAHRGGAVMLLLLGAEASAIVQRQLLSN